MIPFGGFEMPLYYKGIRQEHEAVRSRAGLFDVSHMGRFRLSGPGALKLVQMLTINDASLLQTGRVHYTAMCDEKGGIIDDLLLYRTAPDEFVMVVNAANAEKDRQWILSRLDSGTDFHDLSGSTAILALQGPGAQEILQPLTELDLGGIAPFTFQTGTVAGQPDLLVSATGYTGEKGYELYINCMKADPVAVWEAILEQGRPAGLLPAGLGARDTLRLEMGYPLYGNELDLDTTPLEAGLGWITRLKKGEFIGSEALRRQKEAGPERHLVGFVLETPRKIARSGHEILNSEGETTGRVTSGTQSFASGKGIGLGYVRRGSRASGERIFIRIREELVPAVVRKPPFLNRT